MTRSNWMKFRLLTHFDFGDFSGISIGSPENLREREIK